MKSLLKTASLALLASSVFLISCSGSLQDGIVNENGITQSEAEVLEILHARILDMASQRSMDHSYFDPGIDTAYIVQSLRNDQSLDEIIDWDELGRVLDDISRQATEFKQSFPSSSDPELTRLSEARQNAISREESDSIMQIIMEKYPEAIVPIAAND